MTDNEIIKAFDILDKFEFFGGQRAGRELWFNKPADIQEKDIGAFLRDLDFLKQLINRQKAEIKALQMDNEQLQSDIVNANMNSDHALAEIEKLQEVIFKKEDLMQTLHAEHQACYDELVQAKSDIKKLTQMNSSLCEEGGKLFRERKTIREKAIKEFAEMLINWAYEGYSRRAIPECVFVSVEQINDLVKEMTEGKP